MPRRAPWQPNSRPNSGLPTRCGLALSPASQNSRAEFDPNVLVSAVISPTRPPRLLVVAWAEGRFELIMSPVLLEELREVLARPKFRQWVSAETAADFVDGLEDSAIVK